MTAIEQWSRRRYTQPCSRQRGLKRVEKAEALSENEAEDLTF